MTCRARSVVLLAALLAAACGGRDDAPRGVTGTVLRAERADVVFGEPFELTVLHRDPAGTPFDVSGLAPLAVRLRSSSGNPHAGERREYVAHALRTGDVEVAPPNVREPLRLRVRSALAADDDLAAELPLAPRRGPLGALPAALIAACALLVAGLVAGVLRHRRGADSSEPSPEPVVSSSVVARRRALAALARLEDSVDDCGASRSGDARWHAGLAGVVRDVAESALGAARPSWTTERVVASLAVAAPGSSDVGRVLRTTDRVRFARRASSAAGRARRLHEVRAWVDAVLPEERAE